MTVSGLKIRKALPADTAALEGLVNSAYRGESSRRGWTTEADLLDGIRTDRESLIALLAEPGSAVFVLLDEKEKFIGCVHLLTRDNLASLGMLTVSPDLQGKGLGKILLATAEESARQAGCTRISLSVISDRMELKEWYVRKGYRPTGEKKPFPSDHKFGIPRKPLEFEIFSRDL